MKMMGRKGEVEFLRETKKLSERKLFTLVIYGLRRVGKTRLILEFLDKKDLYLFVNKNKESGELLKEYTTIFRKRNIITKLEEIKDWDNFFDVVFKRFNGLIAFDEFQNFNFVDPKIFGILQKNIDLNENKKNLLIIFSGSLIGLIKKLFRDSKEPLYGRIKRKLFLKQLSLKNIKIICNNLNINSIEEIIKLYSIFGGLPKYYVSIEDEHLEGSDFNKIIDVFFFKKNALFEDEVQDILASEFGRRSGIYYSILSAVASGCNKLNEIAGYLGKKETTITRQIYELVNYFEILSIEKPIIGKKKLFFIKHPLINFWFKYFFKNLSEYSARNSELISKIKQDINNYLAQGFENICIKLLNEKKPFSFTKIGKQWGKFQGEKGKNVYDIDIVAINEKSKEILFGECKWQNKVNAEKIIKELMKKIEYVRWHNEERKENFVLFAKSFSKKIKRINNKPVYCYDLRDLEKILKR